MKAYLGLEALAGDDPNLGYGTLQLSEQGLTDLEDGERRRTFGLGAPGLWLASCPAILHADDIVLFSVLAETMTV